MLLFGFNILFPSESLIYFLAPVVLNIEKKPETLNELGVTNFEMETSAIYGLSKLLGHKAVTINNVIANRRRGEFSADHHQSEKNMIEWVLERVIK